MGNARMHRDQTPEELFASMAEQTAKHGSPEEKAKFAEWVADMEALRAAGMTSKDLQELRAAPQPIPPVTLEVQDGILGSASEM